MSRPGALLATAIFALHPLQVETVAYVSGRGDLLAGLFALLAVASALRFEQEADRKRRGAWLFVGTACLLASLLCKEAYIGLPIALAGVALARGKLRSSALFWWSGWRPCRAIWRFGLRSVASPKVERARWRWLRCPACSCAISKSPCSRSISLRSGSTTRATSSRVGSCRAPLLRGSSSACAVVGPTLRELSPAASGGCSCFSAPRSSWSS